MIRAVTIKSKLMIAFFSIAFLVVVIGIVGLANSLRIKADFNTVAYDASPELVLLGSIQSSVNKVSSDIVGFALISPASKPLHQERLNQLMQDSRTLNDLMDQLGNKADHKSEAQFYPQLKHLTSAYSAVSLKLINSKINRMNEQSILSLISSIDDAHNEIDVTINKMVNVEKAELQTEVAKADEAIRTQQIELIIASLTTVIASLVIGRQISQNSIIKPLLKLREAAIQIAHGNFGSAELNTHGQSDEIGELSRQFDTMRQILDQRTRELEESNKQLSVANERLQEHDKIQRDFINIAAHELRSPVQPLLMGCEELKRKMPNEEIVSIVLRNAKKLQTLANVILDAARIESSSFALYRERVNLKDLISDVLQTIRDDKDKLKISYEPKDIFVDVDKDRIAQVISNLLSNAVKFTNEGTISVITEEKKNPDQVIVSIKYIGEGIEPGIISRPFTKFATRSFDGTGLGLFISRRIIETHGGQIWAGDNKCGIKGSTVSFSLPMPFSSPSQTK
jgi:signal transduction histidine kinase